MSVEEGASMSAIADDVVNFATIDLSMESGGGGGGGAPSPETTDMRQRRPVTRSQGAAATAQHAHNITTATPLVPLACNYYYTADKDVHQPKSAAAWWRWLRPYVAPTREDRAAWRMHYDKPRTASRCGSGVCAGFSLLVTLVVLVIVWDVATSSDGELRTAQLVWQRDHVRIVPQLVLKESGVVVHNVLNPARAIESVGEVTALMHKIRHAPTQRVGAISAEHLANGYVPYRYISARDLDADPIDVNVTLDALKSVMRAPINSNLVCEGAIHYNVERNVIAVYDWGRDTADTSLLYNVRVVERSESTERASDVTIEQEHCRITDIILAESNTRDEQQIESEAPWVPQSATIEYTIDNGLKKRTRIHQPLLACIENVLRLSGL